MALRPLSGLRAGPNGPFVHLQSISERVLSALACLLVERMVWRTAERGCNKEREERGHFQTTGAALDETSGSSVPSQDADSAAQHNRDFYLPGGTFPGRTELLFCTPALHHHITMQPRTGCSACCWESTACRAPFIHPSQSVKDISGFRWGRRAPGPHLQVVVVGLAVGLVVVWVVHLIQEIHGEPPGQTGLGHKHVLPQTRRVDAFTNEQRFYRAYLKLAHTLSHTHR